MKSRIFSLSSNLIFYPTETPLFDLLLGLHDAEKITANLTFALAVWLNQDLIENLDKKNGVTIFYIFFSVWWWALFFSAKKKKADLFHSKT